MHTNSLVAADAAAVRETVRLVAGLTTTDFERPTPCESWDLGMLLTHMTVQHRGFAAAAAGNGADPTAWEMPEGWWLPDIVRGYAASAELVLAAFRNPAPELTLPELGPVQTFPAAWGSYIDPVVIVADEQERRVDAAGALFVHRQRQSMMIKTHERS